MLRIQGFLQEIQIAKRPHDVQIVKRFELPRCQNSQEGPRCQESKGSTKGSKGPRDPSCPSVQELPREVHIIRSRAFSLQSHFLYCKRPIIGVVEPSIVKAKFVQACNQRKGPSRIAKHVMKVLVNCLSCALILHHSRNSP